MKLFTSKLDEKIHKELRILAAISDKKIIDLLEEAILDLFKKYNKED